MLHPDHVPPGAAFVRSKLCGVWTLLVVHPYGLVVVRCHLRAGGGREQAALGSPGAALPLVSSWDWQWHA